MKKYLLLIFSLIFILSIAACKSTEDPKPITLAERAGTYTGNAGDGVFTLIINANATGSISCTDSAYTQPEVQIVGTIGDPNSTDKTFDFTVTGLVGTYNLTFDNSTKVTLKTGGNNFDGNIYILNK